MPGRTRRRRWPPTRRACGRRSRCRTAARTRARWTRASPSPRRRWQRAAAPPATAALAHAQEAKGDFAAAEASYREAMAAEPAGLGAVVGLATVLRKTGRAAEAEPMLKKAIDASPGAVEAYKELARVKIALGRAQEALADANLAAAMAENDPDAQALVVEAKVGRALQDLAGGQADLAVQDLTQLRDQNPASAAVRLGLGRAQIARRDADAALPELQKAVELDPRNAEAQYQLGYVYHVMKQNAASAVGPYGKAVEAEPGNTLFRTSLGSALTDAGQLDRAVQELTKVTGSEGYSGWQAWFFLGAAQLKASRYKEAAAALEKAVGREAGQRPGGGVPRLVLLRPQGRGELQGARREGAQAGLQGPAALRSPDEGRGGPGDQVAPAREGPSVHERAGRSRCSGSCARRRSSSGRWCCGAPCSSS